MFSFARVVAGVLSAAVLLAPVGALAGEKGAIVFKTTTGEHSFDIEVMRTGAERAKGLMFRRSLPERSGMLFLYDRPQAANMWMKNTYIPLDMVFIAEGGTVHRIEANTEPFSTALISSEGDIVAVLELNAGEAARIGLKPGDQAIYPGLKQAR
jgi:uncharacterized membrane protein (UPF0127 family)